MLISFILAMSVAFANAGGQLPPQDPSALQDAPPTQVEDVIVQGRRLRDAVDAFVDEIVASPVGRGPARWDRKVCVGVVNFNRGTAQALADQVSSVAMRVGLEVGEPGCSPNILIIATGDGPGLAQALVASRPRAFRPAYAGAARAGGALEHFQSNTSPVRWWHVSVPVTRDLGLPATRMPGERAPVIRGEGLLRSPLRNNLLRAFVIVDVNAAHGYDVRNLGDYVAMVALAQIDPEADTSAYDTVLNLFDPAGPEAALTDWDMAYLGSLYDAELHQRNRDSQNAEVATRMYRSRVSAQDQGGAGSE